MIPAEYRLSVILIFTLIFILGCPVDDNDENDPSTGVWKLTGRLNHERDAHTATLLKDGRVLVVGGYDGEAIGTVEIYDPDTGTWVYAQSLQTPRSHHTATLLPNGTVLVVGGYGISDPTLNSAEIFDLSTETWRYTESKHVGTYEHTATLLPNGNVLIAGGFSIDRYVADSEIYDLDKEKWTTTGSLNEARGFHTSTLLNNDLVLAVGGQTGLEKDSKALSSAELYDTDSGTWRPTGSLNDSRYYFSATLLDNGLVLAAGGKDDTGYLDSAELYDPNIGSWNFTGSMHDSRGLHSASLLSDGSVIIGSGESSSDNTLIYLTGSEKYEPVPGKWIAANPINAKRSVYTATVLDDGRVLAAGGYDGNRVIDGAELY
jgi:N-acetylneuraminic acid mutarotase